MSTTANNTPGVEGPWAGAFADLQAAGAGLGEFLDQRLDELEQLAATLEADQAELCRRHEALMASEATLIESLRNQEQESAHLAARLAEMAQAEAELALASTAHSEEREAWIDKREHVTQEFEQKAADLANQSATLATLATQLEAERAALAEERQAVSKLAAELPSRHADLDVERS